MTKKKNDDCFVVRYTNKDIMDKLTNIHTEVSDIRLLQQLTNGKVKRNTKLIYALCGTFGTCFLFLIGWLLKI